jgi:cytidine deaminase
VNDYLSSICLFTEPNIPITRPVHIVTEIMSTTNVTHRNKDLNAIVYNVSHSDVIYGLPKKMDSNANVSTSSSLSSDVTLGRATFSRFFSLSQQVLTHVRSPKTNIHIELGPRSDGRAPSPVGLRLSPPLQLDGTWADFRFRDKNSVDTSNNVKPIINVIYFPLIAISIPEWVKQTGTQLRDLASCLKIIYLVSGSGTPRNTLHARMDNSTRAASELISTFLNVAFQHLEITSEVVHSQDDVFRCRDNVEFVNRHLRPQIDTHRRRLAAECGENWRRSMHITLALTDGAPARIQALQACLRNYHPVFLHVWQLKSFWYNRTLTVEDIDFQTFEDMETRPPVNRQSLPMELSQLVDEMVAYKKDFDEVRSSKDHELHQFWLRKTGKPVLSVLMVDIDETEKAGGTPSSSSTKSTPRYTFFRGINCEVSMPTGSLCSERNAIGTALATNTNIRRSQFKAVAILSTSKVSAPGKHKPLSPRRTLGSVFTPTVPHISKTADNTGNIQLKAQGISTSPSSTLKQVEPKTIEDSTNVDISSTSKKRSRSEDEGVDAWRIKRLRAYSAGSEPESPAHSSSQGTDLIHEGTDLNPIAPCGACTEWLKKIAEVNPDLKIVMFEDTTCETVFVRSIWGVDTT